MNFDLNLSVIGDDSIILLDDYNNITRLGKDLDIEPSFSLKLENNETILNIYWCKSRWRLHKWIASFAWKLREER